MTNINSSFKNHLPCFKLILRVFKPAYILNISYILKITFSQYITTEENCMQLEQLTVIIL